MKGYMNKIKDFFKDKGRTTSLLIISAVFLAILIVLAPAQINVFVRILAVSLLAGFVGYWIDRILFPSGRPHLQESEVLMASAWLRRALIVSSIIIGSLLII